MVDCHATAHYKCFYKFYQGKFADCDTGLLIKDGWNDRSWFLMNGKSRKKNNIENMSCLKGQMSTCAVLHLQNVSRAIN